MTLEDKHYYQGIQNTLNLLMQNSTLKEISFLEGGGISSKIIVNTVNRKKYTKTLYELVQYLEALQP